MALIFMWLCLIENEILLEDENLNLWAARSVNNHLHFLSVPHTEGLEKNFFVQPLRTNCDTSITKTDDDSQKVL